jgi:hypothetical protein
VPLPSPPLPQDKLGTEFKSGTVEGAVFEDDNRSVIRTVLAALDGTAVAEKPATT